MKKIEILAGTQKIAEAHDLMDRSDAAILSTIDENGFPATRAMLNLRNKSSYPSLCDFMSKTNMIYFTTNTSLSKVRQIQKNPNGCVYFFIPSEFSGLTIQGTLEIITDRSIKSSLWQNGWTMYYTSGIDDPEYTIFRLKPVAIKGYRQLSFFSIAPEEL
jgi:general stress protein 26